MPDPLQLAPKKQTLGFAVPTLEQLKEELSGVVKRHDPEKPKTLYVSQDDGYLSYDVREERRFWRADNRSIQWVSFFADKQGKFAQSTLTTINSVTDTMYSLQGDEKGTVTLTEIPIGSAALSVSKDITQAMAKAGITAKDIREMQKNIAYDGAVDRTEQQKIINYLTTAKEIAGIY